ADEPAKEVIEKKPRKSYSKTSKSDKVNLPNEKFEDMAISYGFEIVEQINADESPIFDLLTKMSEVSKSDRPKLAEQFFRDGLMKMNEFSKGRNKFLEVLQYAIHSEFITWIDVLRIISSYVAIDSRPEAFPAERMRSLEICKLLLESRTSMYFDKENDPDYSELQQVVYKLSLLLVHFITLYSRDEHSEDKYTRDLSIYENTFLEFFVKDDFFVKVMQLSEHQPKIDFKYFKDEVVEAIQALKSLGKYERFDETLKLDWNHSIVGTTTAVFVSVRMNVHYKVMADELEKVSTMVGIPDNLTMWKYSLRTALFLMMDTPATSPIRSFVEYFLLERLPLMINLDRRNMQRLLEYTVKDSRNVLNQITAEPWILFQEALERLNKRKPGERKDFERNRRVESSHELITRSPHAIKVVEGMKAVKSPSDLEFVLGTLFDSSCLSLNCVLAQQAMEGGVQRMSEIMASFNRSRERPSDGLNGERRWKEFDASFCALIHTYYTVNRLGLREMVCGDTRMVENTEGVFYRWIARFGRRDSTPNDHRDLNNEKDEKRDERGEKARGFIRRLMSQCPLVEDDSNYSDLFDILPYLSRLLLEEVNKSTYEMQTALSTLSSSPSIVYCILMWLYCLDHSDARMALVKSMHRVMMEMHTGDEIWRFMLHSSSPIVVEMMKGRKTLDSITTGQLVAAYLPTPLRYRHEVANPEMLKKGLTRSYRQNWIPPSTLDLLESCNHGAKHVEWVQCWMRDICKSIVMDDMMNLGELMMGAAMIDPLQSCRAICQVLGDAVFDEVNDVQSTSKQEMAPCLFVFLSRFIAQMLVMGMWACEKAEQRLGEMSDEDEDTRELDVPVKRLRFQDDYVEDVEDEAGMLRAHLRELRETIAALFARMTKACRKGYLRNSVSSVSLVLKELAVTPESVLSTHLTKMVSYDMLEMLARIDPLSVPFELICYFVTEKERRLEFLCKLRKWKRMDCGEKSVERMDHL
ncbi:hypothetical protein PFISCL1PPCAC_2343, partial [Pristionchus fissidentatus]